jgi:peroxiredoxin Q/BCP
MAELKEGSKAPAFTGFDQDGNKVTLRDFLGKRVVLYFYPRDNTPGCTTQACNLRDNHTLLLNEGFKVIGISTDSIKSHKKFEQKFKLPFTLIADEDRKIFEMYGVWGEKKFMGITYIGTRRTTILIDENGKIKRIIKKANTKDQAQQVLDAWTELS